MYQWIDLVGITAQLGQRITHSCKIYNCWDSSEVLESSTNRKQKTDRNREICVMLQFKPEEELVLA
jgi:hypothetical protein